VQMRQRCSAGGQGPGDSFSNEENEARIRRPTNGKLEKAGLGAQGRRVQGWRCKAWGTIEPGCETLMSGAAASDALV
jgi:hypothetical protein